MNKLTLAASLRRDARPIQAALSTYESLSIGGFAYGSHLLLDILTAIFEGRQDDAIKLANDLAVEATPEEGFPFPQRALVLDDTAPGVVGWCTPSSDTRVSLSAPEAGRWVLEFDFGRDSRWAALEILLRVSLTSEAHRVSVRIDDAPPVSIWAALASAAQQYDRSQLTTW